MDSFHLVHLIVKKLDVFNFHPIFYYCYTNCYCYHTRFEHVFFKIDHKWKYYREVNQDLERFSIILSTKMSAKSKKKLKIIAIWREEQSLWDVMSPSYWDKNEKDKSFRSSHRRCSLKKVLLEILQIHRKIPMPESFF